MAQVERLRNFFREHPVERRSRGARGRLRGPPARAFREALADDFNTPRAMAEAFELVAEANRERRCPERAEAAARDARARSGSSRSPRPRRAPDEEAERLLAEREEARAAKDFERADEIRDRLAELGWEVRDAEGGARLVPKG